MSYRPRSAPKALQPSDNSTANLCCCMCRRSCSQSALSQLNQAYLQLQDELLTKEHQLKLKDDKIKSLAVHQTESLRKDDVISNLREDVAILQRTVTNNNIMLSNANEDTDKIQKQLQDKDERIRSLDANISEMSDKLAASTRKVSLLQSQLNQKSEMIASHCQEMRQLKKEKRLVDDNLSLANEQTKNKKTTISSLQDKNRQLKSDNEQLQKKIESIQMSYSDLIDTEHQLRSELVQIKAKSNQVASQLSNTQELLQVHKQANDELKSQLDSTKDELNKLCHSLSLLVGLQSTSKTSSSVNEIVTNISAVITEQIEAKQNCTRLEKLLNETRESYSSLLADISSLSSAVLNVSLKEKKQSSQASSVKQVAVNSCLHSLQSCLWNYISLLGKLQCQVDSVCTEVRPVLIKWNEIDQDDFETSTVDLVRLLINKSLEFEREIEILHKQMSTMTETNSVTLKQVLATAEESHSHKLAEEKRKISNEEKEKNELLQDELKSLYEAKLIEKEAEHLQETSALLSRLEEMEKELESKSILAQQVSVTSCKVNNEKNALQKKLDECIEIIKENEIKHDELVEVNKCQMKAVETELQDTINQYKVQCQQHAITIVSLESKLLNAQKDCDVWKEQLDKHKRKSEELKKEIDAFQAIAQNSEDKSKSLMVSLRRQLTATNVSWENDRAKLSEMEDHIRAAQNAHKYEIDKLNKFHSSQLSDLKQQLSQKENEIFDLKKKLERIESNIPTNNDNTETTLENHRIPAIEETAYRETAIDDETQTNDTDGIDSPLMATGYQCLGENHAGIIESQRIAISEMRRKLKILQETNPPVPSHQAALKELASLRQELIQLKADNAVAKREQRLRKDVETITEVPLASEHNHYATELEEALQESEKSYVNLIKSLCEMLSIPFPPTFKSLHDTNKVSRQHICRERNEFITSTLTQSLTALRHRKQSHPKPHHKDTSNHEEPKKISTVSPDLSGYGVYSSDILEQLDQEKRLQQAMSKRQEFSLSKRSNRRRAHSCLSTPDEVQKRIDELRKIYCRKIDKKSAEIFHLKKELNTSQQNNDMMASRLKLMKKSHN